MEDISIRIIESLDKIPHYLVYIIISISSMLQQWFPPYPGDTFASVAGFMSRIDNYSTVGMFMTFWGSTVVSSVALFETGKKIGQKLMSLPIVTKYFPEKSQANANKLIERFHIWALIICKFVPGVNSIAIIMGATIGFKRIKAYLGIMLGSFFHNMLFFIAGLYLGRNIDKILQFFKAYNIIAYSLVGLIILGIIAYKIIKKRRGEHREDIK